MLGFAHACGLILSIRLMLHALIKYTCILLPLYCSYLRGLRNYSSENLRLLRTCLACYFLVKALGDFFLFKRTSFSIFKKLDSYFLNISWSKSQHKKLSEIQLGTCVQSKYLGKYLVKTRVTGQKITIHLYSPRMMVKKVKTWL